VPIAAIWRRPHVHPIVVMVKPCGGRELLRSCREAIVAHGFHACLWIRPRERWIVSAHPDALVVVLTIGRVLDVVTDKQRVADGGVQLSVEMSAMVDAA